jgi:mannose/cellobiose epimerase-like protein (N-acyl-D-glucosamine 2-epimerase family)
VNEKIPMIESLYEFAILGSNKEGLGYNETDYEGMPTRPDHRMWIQTEVIKANIAMYRKTKSSLYLERTYEAWNTLFSKYLIEKYAVWYDELDDEGNNISTTFCLYILR